MGDRQWEVGRAWERRKWRRVKQERTQGRNGNKALGNGEGKTLKGEEENGRKKE